MYKEIISPLLDRLDSETWHVIVRETLHHLEVFPGGLKGIEQFSYKRRRFSHPKLHCSVMGIEFDNPMIGGAGWDKAGRAVKGLWQLGAAGVEVGGVPKFPQKGNVRPRQWVVAPGVIVNALGFNSPGARRVAGNLARYEGSGIPIGIQITANKNVVESEDPQDHIRAFVAVIWTFYSIASWFTLGVSSPNTVSMRERYQDKEWLALIASACIETMEEMGGRRPLFIKISPDLTWQELDQIIEVAMEYGVGIVASNTTVNAGIKTKYGWGGRLGGLSGDDPEFRALSTRQIAYIHTQSLGMIPIMGAGGVKDCATALEKINAGALALPIVSAVRGEGPGVFGKINRDLVDYMDREGIDSIQELVGIEAHKYR